MTSFIAIKLPRVNSTLKLPEHDTRGITFLKSPKMPILNYSVNQQTNLYGFRNNQNIHCVMKLKI